MDKQVEIKKIVIRIGDKEASLTLEDAKALRDVLDAMFGEKKEYVGYPYVVPTIPYVPYVQPTWRWYDWTVNYCNVNGTKDNNAIVITSANSASSLGG